MLLLFETAAGYAVFETKNDLDLKNADVGALVSSASVAKKNLTLKTFRKFKDTTDALEATAAMVEGKLGKELKKVLKKLDSEAVLGVADTKLGNLIKDKVGMSCVSNTGVAELMRGVRAHIDQLVVESVPQTELRAMALGLAHSLSRYKLKFNPDKVDTMIIQAVSLLDDLDKELNNYVMRCREWYSWHFPELNKIIQDHIAYARVVSTIGTRQTAKDIDLSDILPEDLEARVKEEAEMSMGSDISLSDVTSIRSLCEQVIKISEYRTELHDYLKQRMALLAPNLTALVGELVGGRLISHAGSLMNLAKYPASTIQILGAEKALFRALKTKRDTPKYGIIYHAQLIGQAHAKLKGKVSRMLAAKVALATRIDALREGTEQTNEVGIEQRAYLESRMKQLRGDHASAATSKARKSDGKKQMTFKSETFKYDDTEDTTMKSEARKRPKSEPTDTGDDVKPKKAKHDSDDDEGAETETPKKDKKKKKKKVKEEPESD